MEIPKDHPRYESLKLRELIADGYEKGLVDRTGLIAHGRGEAFDYLLGEKTQPEAEASAKAAAAYLLRAKKPVISVNGNTAVLVPHDLVELAELVPAKLEVNIFHRSSERIDKLVGFLKDHGATTVLGKNADATIPNLSQPRSFCEKEGIYNADTVFVPLEDGDRAGALVAMKKTVIVVDLNPFSRSSRFATVTIVDNLVRTMKVLLKNLHELKKEAKGNELNKIISGFKNEKNLKQMTHHLNIKEKDI